MSTNPDDSRWKTGRLRPGDYTKAWLYTFVVYGILDRLLSPLFHLRWELGYNLVRDVIFATSWTLILMCMAQGIRKREERQREDERYKGPKP